MIRRARAASFLVLCGVLAGCATHASARDGVPPARFLLCQSLADGCAGAATPKYEPSVLYMSGDGSLWAKDVTWSNWGAVPATGRGTAEVDSCLPSCAQGTFSAHPVTITLSRPESWHRDMVYMRAAMSIPALDERATFAMAPMPTAAPPVSTQPAPGALVTQDSVTGWCIAGNEPAYANSNGTVAYGPFNPGQPFGYVTIAGSQYAPTLAYRLNLTNRGAAAAAVHGFVVAFYDSSGQELGSDQETFDTPTYITSGQSLAWTLYSGRNTLGNAVSGDGSGTKDDNIPAGAFTCQMVEWMH